MVLFLVLVGLVVFFWDDTWRDSDLGDYHYLLDLSFSAILDHFIITQSLIYSFELNFLRFCYIHYISFSIFFDFWCSAFGLFFGICFLF